MKTRKRRRPIIEAADPRFRMMGAPLHMPLRPVARPAPVSLSVALWRAMMAWLRLGT